MKFKLIYLSLILLSAMSARSQASSADNEPVVLSKDALQQVLSRFSFSRFYLSNDFQDTFLDKKTKTYGIPADETIVAYLDASTFTNAKHGIAIGLKGLYINNTNSSSSNGKRFIAWTKYKMFELVRDGKKEFRIEFDHIDVSALNDVEKSNFEELLREIKSKLLK